MKKLLLLVAVVAMVLSGCGKIEESIDALGGRLDKLEQEAIPTIDEQISAINTTLGGLDAMDKELKGYIDNLTATALSLQEQINATNSKIDAVKAELQGEISAAKTEVLAQLESAKAELEGKLAQINATIETLKAKDAELDQKIADLRSYVDTKLGKTTDWVTATFATLEQLNSLSDEVATLKSLVDANKTEAATNLANAISALEISLKKWVGEQLSNYYTIAEIDAKILVLQNALAEGDIALQEELNALKSQLETAKAELTEAYKKAIKEAIETNNGIIEGRIASEVVAINQRINSEVATLNQRIAEVERRLANLEGRVNTIEQQIVAINFSLDTLEDVDSKLKESIKALEASDKATAEEIAALKGADKVIEDRINALRKYVDDTLKATTDWVTATFATLEQLNSLSDEVATLKSLVDANKTEAATNLANAISALEISLKKWVGEQLSNYYTIAEIDAKILVLQNALAEGDIALQEELNALKSQLETAKAELTEAYKKAIKEAIETNNGIIEGRIASEVVAINQRINSEVATLNQRIAEVERRLANLEGRVNTIEQQISAINTTLGNLDIMDKELEEYIESLQAVNTQLQNKLNTIDAKLEALEQLLGEGGGEGDGTMATEQVILQLEMLKSETTTHISQINNALTTLQNKDKEIEDRISQLRTYVDTELGKTTDWANATFATLDQYNSLVEDITTINAQIEAINEGIYDLETRLTTKINEDIASAVSTLNSTIQQKVKEVTDAYTAAVKSAKEEVTSAYTAAIATAISNLETSLKAWVGEQLSNYYTIAEIDALLTTLEQEINGKLEAQKTYLEGLIDALSEEMAMRINSNSSAIEELRARVSILDAVSADSVNKIAENASAIATNAQNISNNAQLISANRNNTTANASKIEECRVRIADNAALIAENKRAIEALKSSTDADIAKNAVDIAANAEEIAKNAELISKNAIAINNNAEAIADNATEIANLKTSLETTKSEITEAYKKAIKDAIDTNNGVINGKIANEVATINSRISSEVSTINSKITELTSRVATLESEVSSIKQQITDIKADISKLLARIQSVSYIPQYEDGKATVEYLNNKFLVSLDFEISPKDAVADLVKVYKNAIFVKAVHTKTRAVTFVNMPIVSFAADVVNGIISVQVSCENLSSKFFDGTQSASVRMEISDGNNYIVSEYIPLSMMGLSQTPTNLALVVKKNGVRSFLPLPFYAAADLDGYDKEGIAIVSDTESFIFALEDAYQTAVEHDTAISLGTMPTYEQARVIIDNWSLINDSIELYGGTSINSKTYWTRYYTGGVSGNGATITVKNYYCYKSSGFSSIRQGSTTNNTCYARVVIATL